MDVMALRRSLLMQMIGGEDVPMVKIGEYTVPESWENDTKGNPVTIAQTVLNGLVDKPALYILDFVGNEASNNTYYAWLAIYMLSDLTTINTGMAIRNKTDPNNRTINASTSFWASAGTKINIYRMEYTK